jgi:hypothetical protein
MVDSHSQFPAIAVEKLNSKKDKFFLYQARNFAKKTANIGSGKHCSA